jgi:hypothetical protein
VVIYAGHLFSYNVGQSQSGSTRGGGWVVMVCLGTQGYGGSWCRTLPRHLANQSDMVSTILLTVRERGNM